MPPSLLPPTPEELEELRLRRRASQLKGYGEGVEDPIAQALFNVRRNLGEAGRAVVGAKPYDETNPTGSYRAVQALMNAPTPAAIIPEAAQAAGKAATALSGLGALGVVKPKGGNWLAGTVERGLRQMKQRFAGDTIDPSNLIPVPNRPPEYPGMMYRSEDGGGIIVNPEQVSRLRALGEINNWIDTKLGKYVRNELGTPEDPVRALAEREILHFTPQGGAVSAHTNRKMLGMPVDPTATSPLAQSWEDVADATIRGGPYREKLPMSVNEAQIDVPETLRQLGGEYAVQNPDALAYELNRGMPLSEGLGFRHLIDELRNATDPDSGLPRSLQLSPEKLQKVTVPQAVELVDKINKWRAEQKAAADLKRSQNAATVEYKAYETIPGTTEPNQRGLRWVELKKPEGANPAYLGGGKYEDPAMQFLADALKYEGEVMGHCVGGYCPDVAGGRTRIYSLRDAKGEPHVTVEVKPSSMTPYDAWYREQRVGSPELLEFERYLNQNRDRLRKISDPQGRKGLEVWYEQWAKETDRPMVQPQPEIVQIKGKANRAPKDEYLPFVQDFVRSGQWSDVGDLRNTGLSNVPPNSALANALREAGEDVPKFMTDAEYDALTSRFNLPKYAAGGLVDLAQRYAAGGAVHMKKGGAVTDPNEPEVKRLPEPGLLTATMYAETAAREMYPKDPVKRDAARHMIASSILGQKLSPGTSRLLGELYEFKTSPLLHLKSAVGLGAPPPGYEMDKFNNALGSELQFRNQAELQRGVRQAVDTGRARLTPDEPAPYRRGGAVKIETNPTLMADELLFKGYRR